MQKNTKITPERKAELREKLIGMLMDPGHAAEGKEPATREIAEWLITSHEELSDADLGDCIGEAAVAKFRLFIRATA